jgi:hypothetical protein
MTRAEIIKRELERIRDRHGRITPKMIVRAARNPNSPLHQEFIWDDRKAANLQREHRARELLTQYIVQTVVYRDHVIRVPVHVRDPSVEPNEQGLRAITAEGLEREEAHAIMMRELGRCESAIERARGISAVLNQRFPGIIDELEQLLSDIVTLRTRMEAAE